MRLTCLHPPGTSHRAEATAAYVLDSAAYTKGGCSAAGWGRGRMCTKILNKILAKFGSTLNRLHTVTAWVLFLDARTIQCVNQSIMMASVY